MQQETVARGRKELLEGHGVVKKWTFTPEDRGKNLKHRDAGVTGQHSHLIPLGGALAPRPRIGRPTGSTMRCHVKPWLSALLDSHINSYTHFLILLLPHETPCPCIAVYNGQARPLSPVPLSTVIKQATIRFKK